MHDTFKEIHSLLEDVETHLARKTATDKRHAVRTLERLAYAANTLALTLKVSK